MNARAFAGAGAIAVVALYFSSGLSQAQGPAPAQPKPTGPAESYFEPPGGGRGAGPAGAAGGARGGAAAGARGGAAAAGAPADAGGRAGGRAGGGAGGFPGGGGGRGAVNLDACPVEMEKICPGLNGGPALACLQRNSAALSNSCKTQVAAAPSVAGDTPSCYGAPFCGNRVTGIGSGSKGLTLWKPNMPYTPSLPFQDALTAAGGGGGGMVSVGVDSKDNVWGLERNAVGSPQLFKFSPDHKLIFKLGDDVITHHVKAHGMKVDAQDNAWIMDEASAVIRKISPDGKVLATIGTPGHRGDWDEAKGQRLLWEPVMIDFGTNGDIFIFEGHHNESPNDADGPDPTNRIGAPRVIHLDKDMKFINQWYGNSGGPGKFTGAHGSAVDPQTGLVWIGDREEYRIVIYQPDGTFVRTIQMKNLVCSIYFDRFGGVWTGTGLDGQLLKIDRDAKVIGVLGVRGSDVGTWGESSYLVMNSKGQIISGDTTRGRINVWTPNK
jgi:hypothetical protein